MEDRGMNLVQQEMALDPSEMTDEQFRLYQIRTKAAAIYRHEGFPTYATRVAAGEVDDCHGMKIAEFFHD